MYEFLHAMNIVKYDEFITSRVSKLVKERRGFKKFYDDALMGYGSHYANRTSDYVSSVMHQFMFGHDLLIYFIMQSCIEISTEN